MSEPFPNTPSAHFPSRVFVIADDLTGAAELAGVAFQHGLRAEVQTVFDPSSFADVIALDTDTRSRSPEDAARLAGELGRAVAAANPAWIYKKTDSVLRGNARVEIEALLTATGRKRARLIPANPSKNRVIRGGRYFVNGVPLDQTPFANDPEHPRRTAHVCELLGMTNRIDVPDVAGAEDIRRELAELSDTTLPAGGVDFFQTLLETRGVGFEGRQASDGPQLSCRQADDADRSEIRNPKSEIRNELPPPRARGCTLFVCGSAAAWVNGRGEQCAARGVPVVPMPELLFAAGTERDDTRAWGGSLAEALRKHGVVMAAIARPVTPLACPPPALAERLSDAVARALANARVDLLCVEGGATAASLARRLGWTRLSVCQQWAGGVVELAPLSQGSPRFVLKVGSYDWPEGIWGASGQRVRTP